MNTIFPNNTPLGPPSTTLGGGFTLTEQAVRQFEGVLEPKWDNIQDIPADLAPSGRVRISEATGATEVQDEAGTVSLSLQGGKASGKLLDSGGAVVNVRAFGAVGDGVANDTAAFLAAFDVSAAVFAPPGTYRISSIDFANKSIYGAGRFLTTLIGDGDLLTNAQACSLHDLAIQNDVTGGKLVSLDGGANLGRSFFERVEFGQANYHIYLPAGSAGVTDWVFENCRFGSAQIISRFYFNCWAFRERGCYTWYNKVGLRMEGGSSMQISDSVFEYNKAEGVQLVATNNAIDQIAFRGVHFESNGNEDGTAQAILVTAGAVRIRSIAFTGCSFYLLHGATHIGISPGGGGNIGGLSVRDCYSQGGLLLPDNAPLTSPATLLNNDFNGSAGPVGAIYLESSLRPSEDGALATLALGGMQKLVGVGYVVGPEAGNGGIQASIVPPPGAAAALILVQGDHYAGTAGANNASWFGWWQGGSNLVFPIAATNSTIGGNGQGFVVSFADGAIQVSNAAVMSSSQNGRIIILFVGA